jgi:2-(1,2-epoxy-1,2-dihydrophenyl)acetyl-CoA isomerase
MQFETIRVDQLDDGIKELVLTRPPANALSKQMAFELRQASASFMTDQSLRALVLRAEGKVFFGGGDLMEIQSFGDQSAANLHEMTIDFHGAVSRLCRMNAPVVGAVGGTAGGAGLSLVASLDLVIAGNSARFVSGYTASGLTIDGTSSFFLARTIGLRRATELALTNRMLSAQEALDWGLVNAVVDDDVVVDEARALATKLAAGPTTAFGGVKRLLVAGASSSLEEAMERESFVIASQSLHPEGIEGVDAFINKRKPNFT